MAIEPVIVATASSTRAAELVGDARTGGEDSDDGEGKKAISDRESL